MAWPEFISRMLESTTKIEKVAVFNSNGAPIAVTEDMSISKLEGQALLCSLNDPSRSIVKINIDTTDFTCYQGNERTLLGYSRSKKKTFIAHFTNDCLILVQGSSEGHGSFLFELKRNLFLWQKRNEMRAQERVSDLIDDQALRNDNRGRAPSRQPRINPDNVPPPVIQQTVDMSTFPDMTQQTLSETDVTLNMDNEAFDDDSEYDSGNVQELQDIPLY